MQPIYRNLLSSLAWALGGLILTGTVVSRFYTLHCQNDYLVIHTIMEFIAVFVSFAIFSMVWLIKDGLDDAQNRFILYFSTSFLAIGCMDFLHAMSYDGMPAGSNQNDLFSCLLKGISIQNLSSLPIRDDFC